jgi:hypothetical protein
MRYVVDRNVVMRPIPIYVLELTAGEFAATHPDHLTLRMLLRPQRNSDDLQKRKSLDHFEDQDLDKE